MPVWIAAGAGIVLLGLIVAIGARERPEDAAQAKRRSPADGGGSAAYDGSAGSGASCGNGAGGGDCGGGGGG